MATPDENTLQAQLAKYRAALEQEYKTAVSTEGSENVVQLTKDFFKDNAGEAAAQVVWLMQNADSESVKLNAAKFVLEKGLLDSEGDGDPIKELLNQLSNPKTKSKARKSS